jgi:hypothetical protein
MMADTFVERKVFQGDHSTFRQDKVGNYACVAGAGNVEILGCKVMKS